MRDFANNVQVTINGAVSAVDTSITVDKAVAPFNDPPNNTSLFPAKVTIVDSITAPTKIEIISYTGRTDNGATWTLTGVTRGLEGTTAFPWSTSDVVFQSVTAEQSETLHYVVSDLTQLQQALDSIDAGSDHGVIRMKPGSYTITSTIIVYSDTTLILEGCVFTNGFAGAGSMLRLYGDGVAGVYTGTHDVTIIGGTFDGADHSSNSTAVTMSHCKDIKFVGTRFTNQNTNHQLEINASQHVVVDQCRFDTYNQGGGGTEMLQIDYSFAGGFPWYGPYDNTPCDDIRITNCSFVSGIDAIGSHSQTSGVYHTNITVTDCTFQNLTGVAVKALGWDGVIVEGNHMDGVFRGYEDANSSGDQEGLSTNIINNIIRCNGTNTEERCIAIWGNSSGFSQRAKDIIIANNTCLNALRHGISINYTDGCHVIGNIVRGYDRAGIWLWRCEESVVSGNIVKDSGTYYSPKRGIYIGASSSGNLTEKTVVCGNVTEAITVDYARDTAVISNNCTIHLTVTGNDTDTRSHDNFIAGTWTP